MLHPKQKCQKSGKGARYEAPGFSKDIGKVQIIGYQIEVSNLLKNMGKSLCPNSSLLDVVVPFIDYLMNKLAFYKYMLQALLYHSEPLL